MAFSSRNFWASLGQNNADEAFSASDAERSVFFSSFVSRIKVAKHKKLQVKTWSYVRHLSGKSFTYMCETDPQKWTSLINF